MKLEQTWIDAQRKLFEASALVRHLDKTMTKDAWERPQYSASHVEAMWKGWLECAFLQYQQTSEDARCLDWLESSKVVLGWAPSNAHIIFHDYVRGGVYGSNVREVIKHAISYFGADFVVPNAFNPHANLIVKHPYRPELQS